MGVADLQIDVFSLQGGPVAVAGDVERLREPFCDARHGVLDQRARKTVHRPMRRRVCSPLDDYVGVLLPYLDPARHGHRELALRAAHLYAASRELYVDRAWYLDGRLSDSRHC